MWEKESLFDRHMGQRSRKWGSSDLFLSALDLSGQDGVFCKWSGRLYTLMILFKCVKKKYRERVKWRGLILINLWKRKVFFLKVLSGHSVKCQILSPVTKAHLLVIE